MLPNPSSNRNVTESRSYSSSLTRSSHTTSSSASDQTSQHNSELGLSHNSSNSKAKGKARVHDQLLNSEFDLSGDESTHVEAEGGGGEDWCLICHTSPVGDRTVLPNCLHAQFCFECILRWSSIKRRCPLCLADIGEYVIHDIRADDDFVRYFLPPPPLSSSTTTRSTPSAFVSRSALVSRVQHARQTRRDHTRSSTDQEQERQQERALEFRKEIYRKGLYAKHVGSNRFTGYKPTPTPAQIKNGAEWGGRISTFVRRELSIWPDIDVEFLTKYIVSLLQVFDVTGDETVRLVGVFLGEEVGRHFLHELECYLRSRKQVLRHYDASPWLQYTQRKKRSRAEAEGSPPNLAGGMREEVAQRRRKLLERLQRERALLRTASPATTKGKEERS